MKSTSPQGNANLTVLMSHVAPEIEWTVRVISALLLLGVLAEIASWIVGPSRDGVTAQKTCCQRHSLK